MQFILNIQQIYKSSCHRVNIYHHYFLPVNDSEILTQQFLKPAHNQSYISIVFKYLFYSFAITYPIIIYSPWVTFIFCNPPSATIYFYHEGMNKIIHVCTSSGDVTHWFQSCTIIFQFRQPFSVLYLTDSLSSEGYMGIHDIPSALQLVLSNTGLLGSDYYNIGDEVIHLFVSLDNLINYGVHSMNGMF